MNTDKFVKVVDRKGLVEANAKYIERAIKYLCTDPSDGSYCNINYSNNIEGEDIMFFDLIAKRLGCDREFPTYCSWSSRGWGYQCRLHKNGAIVGIIKFEGRNSYCILLDGLFSDVLLECVEDINVARLHYVRGNIDGEFKEDM